MKKTKKLKLKKEAKISIYILLMLFSVIILISSISLFYKNIEKQEQKEVETYKQCIYDQHKKNGYIVRSSCSSNWAMLDKKANIKYKQIKKDVYLVSIDNLEF